jgi:uncharacterized membrane protein YeaQ/YmgE (transglycosylase-associated protein family)
MGIIAWILLGLVSGLLAHWLLPGRNARGFVLTCTAAVCGALFGGWAAVSLLHAQTSNSFFSIPAWLTALTGAAIFVLACRGFPRGSAEPWPKGKSVPVVVPVRRRDPSR